MQPHEEAADFSPKERNHAMLVRGRLAMTPGGHAVGGQVAAPAPCPRHWRRSPLARSVWPTRLPCLPPGAVIRSTVPLGRDLAEALSLAGDSRIGSALTTIILDGADNNVTSAEALRKAIEVP